jgi:outer membrane protein OmpA-like peptidoglycan-associated protein
MMIRRLRATPWSCFASAAALAAAPHVGAQQVEQGVAIVSESIASRVGGFSYRPDTNSDLDFRGTALASLASGTARVHTASERTEITSRFEHLPPAASLGPLAVYVLWVITPEGQAHNLGALDIDSDKGRLNTTTPLSSFALIVTAEPHFAVSIPSKYVVLQSAGKSVQGTPLVVTSLASRANYDTLQPVHSDPKHPIPVELVMAHYAVAIADSIDREAVPLKSHEQARAALAAADTAQASKKSSDRTKVPELSREAIQAAEDARAAAETHRGGTELAALRKQLAERDSALQATELRETQTHQEKVALEARIRSIESHLPSAASRQQLATQMLSRWLVLDPSEGTLTAHLASDEGFVKGRTDLVPVTRERLSVAAGILIGMGNVSVTVTPALQASEDVHQLTLSNSRTRALVDWLASLGVRATAGEAGASAGAVEKALAPGPGVELVFNFEGTEAAASSSAARP